MFLVSNPGFLFLSVCLQVTHIELLRRDCRTGSLAPSSGPLPVHPLKAMIIGLDPLPNSTVWMNLCRKATVLCHPVTMKSKYSQYSNRSMIHSYYAFAKNMTSQELDKHIESKRQLTTLNIVIVVLCAIIILENLLVLIAVCRNKKFHSAMFFFIGNLAFSDLLAGSAYIANIFLSGSRTFELVQNYY